MKWTSPDQSLHSNRLPTSQHQRQASSNQVYDKYWIASSKIDREVSILHDEERQTPIPQSSLEQYRHDSSGSKCQTNLAPRQKYSSESKVFFKCLPRTITKEEVFSQFSRFGRVIQVRLPYSKKKQKYIGYGFVVFENESIAKALINDVKTIVMCNKPINLQAFKDLDGTSWQELKQIDQILDHYQNYLRRQRISYDEESYLPRPTQLQASDRQYPRSSFYSKWNLHVIKPNHSCYYVARQFMKDMMVNTIEPAYNLRFRLSVLKPPHLLKRSVEDELSGSGSDYKVYQVRTADAKI